MSARQNIEAVYPLSPMQQGMLFHTLYAPESGMYFEQLTCTLQGNLNITQFERAWQRVVDRHSILRTAFVWDRVAEPLQVVGRRVKVSVEQHDWRATPVSEQHIQFDAFLREDKRRGFKLSKAPLMRLVLIRLSDDKFKFIWSHHHLLLDGWSMSLVLRETFDFYEAFCRGADIELPGARPYRDYIAWLQQQSKSEAEAFWQEQLSGFTAPTPLRVDRVIADLSAQAEEYSDRQTGLTEEVTAALLSLSRAHQLTLNTFVQAAWSVLLSRYSGINDVMYGAVMSGRPAELAGVEKLIGMFINTLPVRVQVPGDVMLLPWLKQLQSQLAQLRQYEYSPLVDVQKWSAIARGLPMFESLLLFENFPVDASLNEGLSSIEIRDFHGSDRANYPLSVFVVPGQKISLRIAFDTRRFDGDTISRMLEHLRTLLEAMISDPFRRVIELPLLSSAEKERLLINWNNTQVGLSDQRIHDMFEAQAERAPGAMAVMSGEHGVTYHEINSRANRLARHLQSLGVGPESRVAICVDRSVEMIVGLLGTLKAGAAYVPLDPSYPMERLAAIMEDSQAPLLLTQEKQLDNLPSTYAHIVCLDSDWDLIAGHSSDNIVSRATPDNLAYIIYTSGSTGRPKGVMITHRGLLNSTCARLNYYEEPVACFLLLSSFAFDSSMAGIFGTLCQGGALLLPESDREYDPSYLTNFVAENRVSHLLTVPSFYTELLEHVKGEHSACIKAVIVAGEACPQRLVTIHRELMPGASLFNEYGPTECTVWSTVFDCLSGNPGLQVPIGRPIDNTQIYLLDGAMMPVPEGVPGELYIGGEGLARGYLHQADLTATTFVPNPFSPQPGARLYKTGDLARYLDDGNILFLGRSDFQIKVRGYRIEAQEIEGALSRHPAVRDAIVMVKEDERGAKRLLGYLTLKLNHLVTTSELREFLKEQLPDYMVPSTFIILDALPLSPNGKVNRSALPVPDDKRPDLKNEFAAPESAIEKILAEVWTEVLPVDRVGIHDDFFELGGDSILSVQVLSKAQEKGLNFTLQQLFQLPTVRRLAQETQMAEAPSIPAPKTSPFSLISEKDRLRLPDSIEDAYPLTTLQMGLIFHSELRPDTAIYQSIHSFHLKGQLRVDLLERVVNELAARHTILRTAYDLSSFKEPLQLVYRSVEAPIHLEDWRDLPANEQEAMFSEWLQVEKLNHFDYSHPPLLRFYIHRRSDETFQFTFTAHHSIFDGWSDSFFLTELFKAYLSLLNEGTLSLDAKPLIPFREYVALEREALNSKECRHYWDQQLDERNVTNLPRWPYSRDEVDTTEFRELDIPICDELSDRLKGLAQLTGVPLKSVLLAAHMRVVSLLYGQPDVITGLVSNGRPEATDSERIIGLFVNTLPFRQRLQSGTWKNLIQQTFEAEKELLPYRRYPLAQIQNEHGGQPLFETCFNFTHFHIYQSILGLSGLELLGSDSVGETNFVLLANFHVNVASSQVGLAISCNAAELSAEQLQAIGGYYGRTLEAIVSDYDKPFDSSEIISEQELNQVLCDWNHTQADYPRDVCLHELFEAQVERAPTVTAVASEFEELSYSDLNKRANQLARYIRKLGVGPDVPVALCLERSVEAIIAILGILKAGGAYVPLDPSYPQDRLAFMLNDSRAPLLLTEENLLSSLPDHHAETVCVDVLGWEAISKESDENLSKETTSDNLAYIIYTSGSTGKPKGVMIEHRSVANLATGLYESIYRDFDSQLRIGLNAPLVFDASIKQLAQLLSGHALIIVPDQIRLDGEAMLSFINRNRVDAIDCTPSQLKLLLKAGLIEQADKRLRLMLVGGEAIDEAVWMSLAGDEKTAFYNVYGPTECTVDTTVCHVQANPFQPCIGRPISNVEAFILDERLRPVPIGVTGELHVGGDGLARGYLNQSQLTAKNFIPNPFSTQPGARLYKTGDAARYLPDGNIEYVGRVDNQVKVRGYRIEPGEIEASLTEYIKVAEAVVAAREDVPGDIRLVAYIVKKANLELTPSELRSFLKERLPDYMIPSTFVMMDALPLTHNGKVNRRALPPPEQVQPASKEIFFAPRTPVEQIIASIWGELFNLPRVGLYDNFFHLGGHSLLATQAVAWASDLFQVKVPLRSLFDSSTLEGFASSVERAVRAGHKLEAPPITRVPRDQRLPLSFAQQRLWFLDQMEPGLSVYNIPTALSLTGPLNLRALEESLDACIERHESMRTSFISEEGLPYQIVSPHMDFRLSLIDLEGLPENLDQAIRRLTREEALHRFDLSKAPLLRAKLLRVTSEHHVLLITMHHIISDGWSLGLLIREIGELYAGFTTGTRVELKPLDIQYADYAVWQRQWLHGDVLEEHLEYWRQQLKGAPSSLDLPTDRPRPSVYSFRGAYETFEISKDMTDSLRRLSRQEGVTLFMALLAAFKTLLYRYTSQEDIPVGTPIAGRTRKEVENLVGFFVNTLVLRTNLSGDMSFRKLLQRVREITLGAYAHQDLPFEKLVEELQPSRDASRPPLFQAMFVLQNARSSDLELAGVTISHLDGDGVTAKFDLSLSLHETDDQLNGVFEYNTDLFCASTINRLLGHFKVLLEGIIQDPDSRLFDLSLLSESERHQLILQWNETQGDYPDLCMHKWFEQQVERTPNSVAVIFEQEQMTYSELNKRANQLAHHLRGLGVQPGAMVGILMEHSLEIVIAVWGVLKTGGAYVPLDPSYPQDRLAFMLEDSQVKVLLAQERLLERAPSSKTMAVCIDSEWGRIANESEHDFVSGVTSDHPAYTIYTSGSTGRPKGVMISHRSLTNCIRWTERDFCVSASDTVIMRAAFSFDVSVWEFFTPMICGGKLIIARPDGQADPAYIVETMARAEVTIAHLVPSLLQVVLQQPEVKNCGSLRTVWCGGEACSVELKERFFSLLNASFYDTYGPTEATISATYYRCEPGVKQYSVPIGRPLLNTQTYILDSRMQIVPVGVRGELYIGGTGLALGYTNQPETTAENFLPDLLGDRPGARLYKTGDAARYLPSGDIEFLGRIDYQVKVRGFRIELGEIEAALNEHPAVSEAAVIDREDVAGDKRLVGYLVFKDGQTPTTGELREFLKKALPEYMIPATFLIMDELPLTPNGKLDRRALRAPDIQSQYDRLIGDPIQKARTEVEQLLIAIWEQLLRVEAIGAHDNFFDLGGHSLLLTQLVSRVKQVFHADISIRSVFEAPTVAEMARIIEHAMKEGQAAELSPVRSVPRGGRYPLSFAQQRLWFMDQMEPGVWIYNTPTAVRLKGALNIEMLEASINEMIRRHETLRTSFDSDREGPFQIIAPSLKVKMEISDLQGWPREQRETEAERIAREEARTPFDLKHAPLVRAGLIKLDDEDHVLLLTLHHIISDGWSMSLLVAQIGEAYRSFTQDCAPLPFEQKLQYLDYTVWQREWLQGEELDRQLRYWKHQLEGAPTMLEMPADRLRPLMQDYRVAVEAVIIPKELADSLKALSRQEGVTLFMTLMAAYNTLLYRWSHQEDMLVGTAIANRRQAEVETIMGFFVNMLVLRTKLTGNITFSDLLARVREAALGAYAHQDLPFDKLVEELQPERALNRTPLFQTVFAFQNVATQPLELPGLSMSLMEVYSGTSPFDLTFAIADTGDGLSGLMGYQVQLYDRTTISRMLEHFKNILQEVVVNRHQHLIDIRLEKTETAESRETDSTLKKFYEVERFSF
ncbi:MAG: amino acid adenylation domain-containing protein [Blastocatellia bacterium]